MRPKNKLPPWLRPKPKSEPAQMKVSVAWYTAAEWRKVKDASVDSDRFEESYAEWLAMAEDAVTKLSAAGLVTERFYIESEELLAWCIFHGKKNDANARAQFVSD